MEFPSNSELDNKISKSSFYLKWKEVPLNTWYKIISKREIDTKIGSALILSLSDHEEKEFTTFTTSLIKKELEKNENLKFIRSTGKPENKKYYGFDLA